MYLIQILLPVFDNDGRKFERAKFADVQTSLVRKFGGLTAFVQSPALGLWKDGDNETAHDEMILVEVMAPQLDREWWSACRKKLEEDFRQDEILIRAIACERL